MPHFALFVKLSPNSFAAHVTVSALSTHECHCGRLMYAQRDGRLNRIGVSALAGIWWLVGLRRVAA